MPAMTADTARRNAMPTVEEILKEHVTLDIESFDRLYLNGYVPIMQTGPQMVNFLLRHRGYANASGALLRRMTKSFIADVEKFAENNAIPMDSFVGKKKKQRRKDDVANEWRRKRPVRDDVVFIAPAQEKQTSFYIRKEQRAGTQRFLYSRSTVCVKHFYFYIDDADFGPAFIKIGTYAPFPIRVCINGHEWAKRQLEKRGITYESLDNGFRSCGQAEELQNICESLGPEQIEDFFLKWVERLPFPLTAEDRACGYMHKLSIWQMEFSRTQVFDRPVRGREFFESVIRENIDLGRPDRVQLLFDRKIIRTTPGKFRTRVITNGVFPSIHINYKSSHLKQYFKENRAARTEFTINNTKDFGVKKGIRNLPYLKRIARNTNTRLLQIERVSHDCVLSEASVERLSEPSVTTDGKRAPGLRPANPRVMSLMAALTLFLHVPDGFRNRDLRRCVAGLMGLQPEEYNANRMGYDLRRLRLKGLIFRLPGTTKYELTPYGQRVSLFLTRMNTRLFRPAFGSIQEDLGVHVPSPLRQAMDKVNSQIDQLLANAQLEEKKMQRS